MWMFLGCNKRTLPDCQCEQHAAETEVHAYIAEDFWDAQFPALLQLSTDHHDH